MIENRNQRDLPNKPQQIHRPKVPMLGLVAKEIHGKQSPYRASYETNAKEDPLRDPPALLFCLMLVGGVEKQRNRGKCGIGTQKIDDHIFF